MRFICLAHLFSNPLIIASIDDDAAVNDAVAKSASFIWGEEHAQLDIISLLLLG